MVDLGLALTTSVWKGSIMLTDLQRRNVWQKKMEAEARCWYFGDLASREFRRKRYIGIATVVIGSSTFISILGKVPVLPQACSAAIAFLGMYQIATSQDDNIRTYGELQFGWTQLDHDFDRLYSRPRDVDAEQTLSDCLAREAALAQKGSTQTILDDKLWQKRLDEVYKKHGGTEDV
jgi:hypothetical protein